MSDALTDGARMERDAAEGTSHNYVRTTNVCDLAIRLIDEGNYKVARFVLEQHNDTWCEKHPYSRRGIIIVKGAELTQPATFCAECWAELGQSSDA